MVAEAITRRNPYMRLDDLARHVGVSSHTIRRLCKQGKVSHERRPGYNGAYMIRASEIEAVRNLVSSEKLEKAA
jgi:DeoR/GlpR family transcriptional regulator of sugar metabolism